MGPVEVFALQLGEGWVLCQPEMDRLMVLNATGKIVWDLLGDGFDQQKIASIFARHFGLPAAEALAHIEEVISGLEGAGFLASPSGDVPRAAIPSPCTSSPALHTGPGLHCGTYRFGDRRIQMRSTLPDIGRDYFSRFWHRALDDSVDADVLCLHGPAWRLPPDLSGRGCGGRGFARRTHGERTRTVVELGTSQNRVSRLFPCGGCEPRRPKRAPARCQRLWQIDPHRLFGGA